MVGLTCAHNIQELKGGSELVQHTLITVTTANARIEQVQRSKENDMDGFVTQLYGFPELVAAIERAIKITACVKAGVQHVKRNKGTIIVSQTYGTF